MHFVSMHELDRKSFRISEDATECASLDRTIALLQQITFGFDHQIYCVSKVHKSQQKTLQYLKELLEELKRVQQRIEQRINECTNVTAAANNPNTAKNAQAVRKNVTKCAHTEQQPLMKPSIFSCMCFGRHARVKNEEF